MSPAKPERSFAAELARLGIGDLHDLLAAQDVDLSTLPLLTEADLRDLGLSLGQRKRLQQAQGLLAGRAAPSRGTVAERRQLTVLFCDLVGSTALASALDPEDLREVITAYHAACKAAVRRHGGHLAYSQGDGLMVFFGYPAAGEDDPERAVRAALEAARAIGRLETPAPVPLKARLGVATGLVVVGELGGEVVSEELVMGEAPNLAARLQEAARPGEVLVTGLTRQLAGEVFDYEHRGALVLKGFPDPVPVFRVVGEGRAVSRFDARRAGGISPMVGRDDELARLLELWQAARGGAGRTVLVRGEAGLGKSRLVRALADAVAGECRAQFTWQCAAHLANRPLHPIARELARQAGIGRDQDPEAARERLRALVEAAAELGPEDFPFLAELLGIDREAERPALDAPARARQLAGILARRVAEAAPEGPVLVVLEDAHWADPATLDFVGLLIERLRRRSALVVVTHRPEFEAPWLGSEEATIPLARLGPEAGSALIDSIAGRRGLPRATAGVILEKAGGVPLFVEELTKAVLDAVPGPGEAQGGGSVVIPTTLHDSLMARLDRLGGAKALAQLGAVIGREFTAEMLAVVAPWHDDVAGDLARLCASGLVQRGGAAGEVSFAFHHALIQDAAYESLLRKRRREVHGVIARAMLDGHPAFAGAEPESVARHCSVAGMAAEALEHWIAAGRHALDRAASPAARSHLLAAMDELAGLGDPAARLRAELDIQMMLAPASMAIFGWASSEVSACCARARALALELGDHRSLFGATWGQWTNFFLRGEMDAALETARAVAAMAEAAGAPALLVAADHAVGFSHYYRGELAEATARAAAGIARFDMDTERQIARMFQFSSTTALHGFAAAAFGMMGREAEAAVELDRSVALAEALEHAPSIAFALAFQQYNLLFRGDWERLRGVSQRLLELSEDQGFLLWVPQARTFLGLCRAAAGEFDEGLAEARENFARYAATGTGLTLVQLGPSLGALLVRAGRPEAAVEQLDALIADGERRHERAYISELYRVRGEARRVLGDAAGARKDIRAACAVAEAQGAAALLVRARATRAALREVV